MLTIDSILEELGNKFTDRSRRVVALSLERFVRLGHTRFDTTHLLHGLYLEGDGVGYHVLSHFDFEKLVNGDVPSASIALAEREYSLDPELAVVRKAIELSTRRMSHRYIGTEHLLIGVAAAGTKASTLLADSGIRSRDLVFEVYNLLGESLEAGGD